MKVHQLIDALFNFDQELDVTLVDPDDYETHIDKAIVWENSPYKALDHKRVLLISTQCPANYN